MEGTLPTIGGRRHQLLYCREHLMNQFLCLFIFLIVVVFDIFIVVCSGCIVFIMMTDTIILFCFLLTTLGVDLARLYSC